MKSRRNSKGERIPKKWSHGTLPLQSYWNIKHKIGSPEKMQTLSKNCIAQIEIPTSPSPAYVIFFPYNTNVLIIITIIVTKMMIITKMAATGGSVEAS